MKRLFWLKLAIKFNASPLKSSEALNLQIKKNKCKL